MNVTAFIQKATCKAFEIKRYVIQNYSDTLQISAECFYNEFKTTVLLKIMPKGACFVDIYSTGIISDEFATKLLRETNVAFNPCILSSSTWEMHVHISFAGNFKQIKKGIAGMKRLLNK